MSQRKKQSDLLPYTEGETVANIALNLIDTGYQVRTDFNPVTLAELANDIAARGVIQPIVVRQIEEGRFLVVAGERRLRAAAIAELTTIPALVRDLSEQEAQDIQLAENIQREDLSLEDTAKGVRKLFDREKNLSKVAALVNKSKSWVCKHLALTMPEMSTFALALMKAGTTEDMEMLNLVSKAHNEYGGWHAKEMYDLIVRGEMNRAKAREFVKNLKAEAEANAKEDDEEKPEEDEEERTPSKPNAYGLLKRIEEYHGVKAAKREVLTLKEVTAIFTEEEYEVLMQFLSQQYKKGASCAVEQDRRTHARMLMEAGNEFGTDWQEAAFMYAYLNEAEYDKQYTLWETYIEWTRLACQ